MPRHSTRPRSSAPRELPDPDALPAAQRARRDRIVDVAVEMMITVNYSDIQVKDIAARADVALGTLYRYFGSKDHLMATALGQWSSGFREFAGGGHADAVVDRVKAVFGRAAKAFERAPRVYGALMHLQASNDASASASFGDFADRQMEAFGSAVATLPEEIRDDVLRVMIAVLSEALRGQQLGSLTHAEVRRRLDRAAELLVGDR